MFLNLPLSHGLTLYSRHLVPSGQERPAIYTRDFNSPSTYWDYRTTNENGNKLSQWASINKLNLAYDPKQGRSFFSSRWRSFTNPDICFVTCKTNGRSLYTSQQYLPRFPRSRHRPIITAIGVSIPSINRAQIPRWNLQKANWDTYKEHVENFIHRIPTHASQYNLFLGLLKSAAKISISRGHRKNYIPGWNKKCNHLWARHQSYYLLQSD